LLLVFVRSIRNTTSQLFLPKLCFSFDDFSFPQIRLFFDLELTNCHKSILDKMILLFDFDYQFLLVFFKNPQ